MVHTDGGRLNHVADGKSLDGLVLGSASRAVGAANGLDVASALLVTAVGRALLHHFDVVGGCLAVEVSATVKLKSLELEFRCGRDAGGATQAWHSQNNVTAVA